MISIIETVDHVQITIPSDQEAQARAFYCDFLKLKEIKKPDNLKSRGDFWLETGNLQVHVGTEDCFDRMTTKAHVAYRVSDISQWKIRLAEQGIEILDGLPIPNCARFEFRDPFGNRVELIQRF